MFRHLFLMCLLIMSMGCSTLPGKYNSGAPDGASAGMDVIGQTPVGASFELSQERYQVIDRYTAASGRDCRMLVEQKSAITQVACRDNNNSWYLREALSPEKSTASHVPRLSANLQTAVAVQPVAVSVDNDKEEVKSQALVTIAVAENENLWRFSKRVTGNALNWQAIADTNGIDNVSRLRVGQKLRIPVELPVLARAQTLGD